MDDRKLPDGDIDNLESNFFDYKSLYYLVRMESELISAKYEQQWSEYTNQSVFMVAHDFGWFGFHDKKSSSACNDVINSILLLAKEINKHEWKKGVSQGKDDRKSYDESHDNDNEQLEKHIEFNGNMYNRLSGDPYSSEGYVYVQLDMSDEFNYSVTTFDYIKKYIAVLNNKEDAVNTARYAASSFGGFGDVCVSSSTQPITHSNFEDWFIDN